MASVEDHKIWFDGNSLNQSAVNKPVDPWVVETRMPAYNSTAMATPPPTVQNTAKAVTTSKPFPKAGVASTSGNRVGGSFDMTKLDAEISEMENQHRIVREIQLNLDPDVLKAAENLEPGQSTDSVTASPAQVVANDDPRRTHALIREKYNAKLAQHQVILMPLVLETSNPLRRYPHLLTDQTKTRHLKDVWHNSCSKSEELLQLWLNRNNILQDYESTLSASEKELLEADRDYYQVQHERFRA